MSKVFPLVAWTGWKPNAHIYRKIIASIEITCGAILVLIPGIEKDLIYTVKPVNKGHPRERQKMVFIDMWSLFGG